MYKCVSVGSIFLIIIMTFCVSHQKLLDNVSSNFVTENIKKEDTMRNHENDTVQSTASIELDFQIISLDNTPTRSFDLLEDIESTPMKVETLSDDSSSFTTATVQKQPQSTINSTASNFPELTTEKLSLTNKSLSNGIVSENPTSVTNYHSLSSSSSNSSTHHLKSTTKQRTNNSSVKSSHGGVRVSGQKIEMPTLNDFFDHAAFLKKHEHGFRYGPHFETGNITNITVQVGNTFYLHCKISLLQDKTVSWVRRKNGENGKQTYSGDPRYSVDFQYPNNWRLKITATQKVDEATYECQINASPPRFIHYNVRINSPTIRIVDEQGMPLFDKYYEVDSTIQLVCIIRHISMMSSVVLWIHNNNTVLNLDVTRGGISVKTDLMSIGANSTLLVAKVNSSDSGNYTCSIGESQQYTVLIHVLNEESLAELHHSGCSQHIVNLAWKFTFFIFLKVALMFNFNEFLLN